ncbi:hypothetical protein BGZ95_005894 [Linnemannia exigua]|uniref:Uncharacterized protein n=1 Tax=Linnemannia exigua TaxID=604196 RepID=A0AAD4D1G4_9FUNG|nr:hypothetical protein BGZ95_005894 [Linnemannia exigua]
MRSAILLLSAAALVAVQAAPVFNRVEPKAESVDGPVRCIWHEITKTYDCTGLGLVGEAEPEAASVNSPVKCIWHEITKTYDCTGLGLVGEAEPEAASVNGPVRCIWHEITKTYDCTGLGLVGEAEPEATSIEPEAGSNLPIRCGFVNGTWKCWGGYDPRSKPQASGEPLPPL